MNSISTDKQCSNHKHGCMNKPKLIVRKDLPSVRATMPKQSGDSKDMSRFIYLYPVDTDDMCSGCYRESVRGKVGHAGENWGSTGCLVVRI